MTAKCRSDGKAKRKKGIGKKEWLLMDVATHYRDLFVDQREKKKKKKKELGA
jgi:hypothetical protein